MLSDQFYQSDQSVLSYDHNRKNQFKRIRLFQVSSSHNSEKCGSTSGLMCIFTGLAGEHSLFNSSICVMLNLKP